MTSTLETEVDPYGLDPHEPGAKLDSGKAPVYQGVVKYFPRALGEVARVSAFGASKYTWGGWKNVNNAIIRYSDAQHRHLLAEEIEGVVDSDSGLLHAAHAAWNALAVLELMLQAREDGLGSSEGQAP